MKTHLWSITILILVAGLGALVFLNGCALNSGNYGSHSNLANVSLKSDQAEIAKLRAAIPKDRRRANDKLKSLLKFFGQVRLPPENIQERYERMFERERERFDKKEERSRENYDHKEQRERDAFDRKQREARRRFLSEHHTASERERFFERQADQEENFNSNEIQKRGDFDSAWHERIDDFNSNLEDKRQEFLEQYRDYSERYRAWKRAQRRKEHCRCDNSDD